MEIGENDSPSGWNNNTVNISCLHSPESVIHHAKLAQHPLIGDNSEH
jgi:hypothetical protein